MSYSSCSAREIRSGFSDFEIVYAPNSVFFVHLYT